MAILPSKTSTSNALSVLLFFICFTFSLITLYACDIALCLCEKFANLMADSCVVHLVYSCNSYNLLSHIGWTFDWICTVTIISLNASIRSIDWLGYFLVWRIQLEPISTATGTHKNSEVGKNSSAEKNPLIEINWRLVDLTNATVAAETCDEGTGSDFFLLFLFVSFLLNYLQHMPDTDTELNRSS